MPSAVMIDGELVSPDHAKVSVLDRGFLYGDSVFETVGTYGGKPYALMPHLERLRQSAERVFISLPLGLDALAKEVMTAIASSGNRESYVRIMVTRGVGPLGLDPEHAADPLRVIIVSELKKPPEASYENGISAITHVTRRTAEATPAEGAKIGNYLVNLIATREARRAGAEEALLVDARGLVVEGATSNIFAVVRDVLMTPPVDAGALAGITRAGILRVAAELGMRQEFRALRVDELRAADEVFISSSIRELLPVVRIDAVSIGGGTPGPWTGKLLRAFRAQVEREIAAE
jgi:branched-chain amino acid aminotransferase